MSGYAYFELLEQAGLYNSEKEGGSGVKKKRSN